MGTINLNIDIADICLLSGGSIGAGLFVGAGGALERGGPASLLLGWGITGIFTMCTIFALAELSVTYPVNGAFFDYTVRFIDPSWFVRWYPPCACYTDRGQ